MVIGVGWGGVEAYLEGGGIFGSFDDGPRSSGMSSTATWDTDAIVICTWEGCDGGFWEGCLQGIP